MSVETEIFKRLEIIDATTTDTKAKVDNIDLWRAGQEERCKAHLEKTSEVRQTVYAKDGLRDTVRTLSNCKTAVKSTRVLWQGFIMGVLKILVATGLLVALGIIFRVWKHLD